MKSAKDINEFVDKNSVSQWGKKDESQHVKYYYDKPDFEGQK